ncbi:MAG: hypothetical protein U0414_08640 [Polyangiaceae bacterium]
MDPKAPTHRDHDLGWGRAPTQYVGRVKSVALTAGAALALLGGGVGCGATAEQLRTRAAFDLQCTQTQLEVVELDSRTRGVRGCGQQATYIESCKACANGQPYCDCTWVLNGDTRPAR